MSMTKFAIDNNRLTLILLLVAIFVGIETFEKMPRAYDPGFIIRTAQVLAYFPGASPKRVEELVTSKIEEVVKEIPELDYIKSESRTGVSIVNVNIKESYKNMRPIWDNLRRKIETVELPDGTSTPQVNDEFGDVFGIVLTITGEGFDYAELKVVADQVKSALLRIPDAAKVDILGDQEERVFIEYENSRLAELGISANQLLQTLQARNIVLSGGTITLGQERIALEPSGNFETIEDIGQTIIQIPGTDRLLYLRDIAKVQRGYIDPPSSMVHSSGTPALAIAISMREGGNNILLGEQVQQAMQTFNQNYPYGIEFDVVNFSPAEVDKKVSDFVLNLLQAILVVSVVMLLTLGVRTGLIVSSLIPISMLLTVIVMTFFEIGLDQISLAALIIALGMLVDNGIVMSESIMVQMEKGKSAIQAAVDSASELKIPLLTASLTTSAAFLPIFLAESEVGEFTASLFKVVTITLLCSWLVSLTVIPLFCVQFLKVTPKEDDYSGNFYSFYRKLLNTLLRHRWPTLGATLAVFIIAMNGFALVPKLFFPPSDRLYFKAEIELPTGTSIDMTQAIIEDLERFTAEELQVSESRPDGVTNWVSYIGNSGPRFILSHNPKPSSSNTGLMILNVTSAEVIGSLMTKMANYALVEHPDLDLKLRLIENGPAVTNPVAVRLSSDDGEFLFQNVARLKDKMREIGGLTNISDDWGQRIKKLQININQTRALRAGISSEDIAVSLQGGISGLELTEYREGEEVIPVLLRSSAAVQNDINKLESLSVYAQGSGRSVPLRQVAEIQVVWDVSKILRRDSLKTVEIGAQLAAGANAAEKFAALTPWLDSQQQDWGIRMTYELGGESESSDKANQSITDKLPIAGFIILILLVAQFNSIRKPIIILTTIPLGLIGVIAGLLLANSFFGFMTFLGVISLAGIVINNAIVLLERIQIELETGLSQLEAILAAAQQRARPILLTTATTVLGLIPLYLGGGEMWEPMAVSIMAGLLFSTLLTLGVVPVLYAILFQVKN